MEENVLPLCPSTDLSAREAAKQLHHALQDFAKAEGYPPRDVQLWDRETAKKMGHVHGKESNPIAQIAWLTGPERWPLDLLDGRSYQGKLFVHNGLRYYLEPADGFVLSFELLDK